MLYLFNVSSCFTSYNVKLLTRPFNHSLTTHLRDNFFPPVKHIFLSLIHFLNRQRTCDPILVYSLLLPFFLFSPANVFSVDQSILTFRLWQESDQIGKIQTYTRMELCKIYPQNYECWQKTLKKWTFIKTFSCDTSILIAGQQQSLLDSQTNKQTNKQTVL